MFDYVVTLCFYEFLCIVVWLMMAKARQNTWESLHVKAICNIFYVLCVHLFYTTVNCISHCLDRTKEHVQIRGSVSHFPTSCGDNSYTAVGFRISYRPLHKRWYIKERQFFFFKLKNQFLFLL